jgi:hypothetical protein
MADRGVTIKVDTTLGFHTFTGNLDVLVIEGTLQVVDRDAEGPLKLRLGSEAGGWRNLRVATREFETIDTSYRRVA